MTMPRPDFSQLSNVRALLAAAYSPDGKHFAYLANTTGRSQLWLQPTGGGFPTQLTSLADRRVTEFSWSQDSASIAFLADLDGDEMFQVFVVAVSGEGGGWPRQLTDRPDVQFSLGSWTPDGRIVISGNDREPTEIDPQLLDPATGKTERLMTGGLHYAGEVSPDGRWLTVVEVRSNTDQDIHLLDLQDGSSRKVTGHEGDAKFFAGPWARDSSGFHLLTDLDREYQGLAFWSFGKDGWEYTHTPDNDVDGAAVSRNGNTLVILENDEGTAVIRAYDSAGKALVQPELPLGVISSLSLHPEGRLAVLSFSTPREPRNIFELDLTDGKMTRREQAMLGGVNPADLVSPGLISYPSFDRDIPGWLYRPEGPGPHPVLLSIHGGPEAQERPEYAYQGFYQYLVTHGIGVLAPNIRGSTGYGKSYQKLIQRDWGGGELRDIEAAAEWLKGQDWVDPARLGVFGASFGGFATLSALARLPHLWSVGAGAVGPSNLVTFARSVPPHWRAMMRNFVGDPDEDLELLIERSPITYVDGISAPLLVYQGANDPRVVKAESDQMVEALRNRGVEVEYHVDERSGHGPADRETAVHWFRTIADFIRRHIGPEGEAQGNAPVDA
jgi:dipeptidyl aminopeptidase/acylaminoacyl peptidase